MNISTRTDTETQTDRQRQAYRTSPSLRPPMIRFSARVWYESTYVGPRFIATFSYATYISYPLYITSRYAD